MWNTSSARFLNNCSHRAQFLSSSGVWIGTIFLGIKPITFATREWVDICPNFLVNDDNHAMINRNK